MPANPEKPPATPVAPLRARRCPICSKPAATAFMPFCSRRCADVDLGRWVGESYRIPVEDAAVGAEDEDGKDADENALSKR